MRSTFDLDVLTCFVAVVELGSLAAAGEQLGRSTSAVSAQMKRLEEVAAVTVFRKQGRGLELTESGAVLLSYARRLLALNDEAVIAMQQIRAGGSCKLGIQQDFCDFVLPGVLNQFIRAHPSVRLDIQVAGNSELQAITAGRSADIVVAWDAGGFERTSEWTRELPIYWIGPRDRVERHDATLPIDLVTLGENCYFRSVATAALDAAARPWRIAMSSPSLSGVWAGIDAGLGITTRTRIGLPPYLAVASGPALALPPLPKIAVSAFFPKGKQPIAESLAELFRNEIDRVSDSQARSQVRTRS